MERILKPIGKAIGGAMLPHLKASSETETVIMPAPAVAQDTFRAMRMTVSDLRLLCSRSLMAKYDKIRELFFK